MSVESLKSFFDVAAVVLLFLTFLAGAGVLITGNVINERQAERLRNFDKDLTEAKIALGRQQERAAAAEADLIKLRSESQPRRLTGEQKEKLARLLSTDPGAIAVVSKIVDPEASDFADDIDSALQTAHWETVRIRNRITNKYGVLVGTVKGTELGDTRRLSDALFAVGIPHEIVSFSPDDHSIPPGFQTGVLYLVIEQKPPVGNNSEK